MPYQLHSRKNLAASPFSPISFPFSSSNPHVSLGGLKQPPAGLLPPVLLPLNLLSTFQKNCVSGPLVLKVNFKPLDPAHRPSRMSLLPAPSSSLHPHNHSVLFPRHNNLLFVINRPPPFLSAGLTRLVPLCGTPPAPRSCIFTWPKTNCSLFRCQLRTPSL